MAQASSFDAPPRASDRGVLRRAGIVLSLAALVSVLVLLEAPLCPSATLLGIPCPGCGLTRATLALLHGDVHSALRLHPLSPLLAPLFFGALFGAALGYVLGPGQRPARLRIPSRWLNPAGWLLLSLVLSVWLSRFFGAFGGPVPVRSIHAAPLRALLAPRPPASVTLPKR